MQNIDEFVFRTLTRGKPRSVPDTKRPYVGVAVFPRDPTVFVAVASIHSHLIHCFPLSAFSLLNGNRSSQLFKCCYAMGKFIVSSKILA
jgi:hypothetical protein